MITIKEKSQLLRLIDRFASRRVLALADFVADEFVDGEISRVSREAPVLILKFRNQRIVPGGGANAVNNLVDLGATVFPISVVGDDVAGRALIDYFQQKRVETRGVLVQRSFHTVTKTRFLAGLTHTAHQQVLRVDREARFPLTRAHLKKVCALARRWAKHCNALLVSDYGIGSVQPALLARIRRMTNPRRCPVTIDSRYHLLDYRGLTASTPNEPEVEAALKCTIGQDAKALEQAGRTLLRRTGFQAVLVTRGKEGMALFERKKPTLHIPIFGSDQVADVTGAGDTVIAVFTLALACGATFTQAAQLANYAGGLVVMKRGTATVTREELISAVESDVDK